MFALAHAVLPSGQPDSAKAIRKSIAHLQRGEPGDLPDSRLAFLDETDWLRKVHKICCTFLVQDDAGMDVRPSNLDTCVHDMDCVTAEMSRQEHRRWDVRLADSVDLEASFDRFCTLFGREPGTGRNGGRLNPLGLWDWSDLGDRFDGWIVGDHDRRASRPVARLSFDENAGRRGLGNLWAALEESPDQAPTAALDVTTDWNVELVGTLLVNAQFSR